MPCDDSVSVLRRNVLSSEDGINFACLLEYTGFAINQILIAISSQTISKLIKSNLNNIIKKMIDQKNCDYDFVHNRAALMHCTFCAFLTLLSIFFMHWCVCDLPVCDPYDLLSIDIRLLGSL